MCQISPSSLAHFSIKAFISALGKFVITITFWLSTADLMVMVGTIFVVVWWVVCCGRRRGGWGVVEGGGQVPPSFCSRTSCSNTNRRLRCPCECDLSAPLERGRNINCGLQVATISRLKRPAMPLIAVVSYSPCTMNSRFLGASLTRIVTV